MKYTRQPKFLDGKEIQITHILEVRLAPVHWNRIKIAAWQRKRTYSTITRYCVLKLARKCSLHWTPRLERATVEVQNGIAIAQDMHRHVMCLYGDDEKLIRLAALDLGITISAFIRIAIELYLQTLAMGNHGKRFITNEQLTHEGIRFTQEVQIYAENTGPWPFARNLHCIRFEFGSYW